MDVSEPNSYDRRREQVRRAQKSHRERKATYVKCLEVEVAELRSQNAELSRKLAEYQNQAQGDALTSRSTHSPLENTLPTAQASVSMGGTTFPNQRLQISYPESDLTLDSAGNTNLTDPHLVINFILSLEQPCLYHHRVTSPELLMTGSIGASGHTSMLSSPIIARAPGFSLNPLNFGYPPDAQWQVSLTELEQLLQTSQKLELDAEITPIQAWSCIRSHPRFGVLNASQLEDLKARLLTLVKCYGFGAVIHRSSFDELVHDFCENNLSI